MSQEKAPNATVRPRRPIMTAARFATGAAIDLVSDSLLEIAGPGNPHFEVRRATEEDMFRRPKVRLLGGAVFNRLNVRGSFEDAVTIARNSSRMLSSPTTLTFDGYYIDRMTEGQVFGVVVPTAKDRSRLYGERRRLLVAAGAEGNVVNRYNVRPIEMTLFWADTQADPESLQTAENVLRRIVSGSGVSFEFTGLQQPEATLGSADSAVSAE
jgi:hypothetical protein